jgi:hypothetical protein
MFDRLVKQPHALARHRDGPLAEERRYLDHCAGQQMVKHTLRRIAGYTLIVAVTRLRSSRDRPRRPAAAVH